MQNLNIWCGVCFYLVKIRRKIGLYLKAKIYYIPRYNDCKVHNFLNISMIQLSSFLLMNVSGQSFLPWFACEKSRRNSRVSISLEPHEFSWRCSFALARNILHCSLWNCWTVYTSCPFFKHELFKSIREYRHQHN